MTAHTANAANAAITANTVVTAQGVSKSFSRKTVLDDVNIQLEEGRIYGLVGRNGTGKSTLLSLLAGQARYKGKIEVFGQAPFDNAEVMDQVVFAGVDTAYPRSWKFGAIVKVAAQRYPPLAAGGGGASHRGLQPRSEHAPRLGFPRPAFHAGHCHCSRGACTVNSAG